MHKGYGRHLHSKIASEPGTRVKAIVTRMARKERRDGASLLNLFEYLRHKALHSPGCLPQGQERILERAKGSNPRMQLGKQHHSQANQYDSWECPLAGAGHTAQWKILSMKRSLRVSFVSQRTTSQSERAVTGSMFGGAFISCSLAVEKDL
jgi:hypothetical protein